MVSAVLLVLQVSREYFRFWILATPLLFLEDWDTLPDSSQGLFYFVTHVPSLKDG